MPPYVAGAQRWMTFVDGENLTIRGQELAKKNGIKLVEGDHYGPDTFLWMPGLGARQVFTRLDQFGFVSQAQRAYYYTSVVGDDAKQLAVRERLRALGFEPEVFKKTKGQEKSKGVDITLTKDMLSHAFMNNYDGALLIAGDGDYVPLVREVKRLGKIVGVSFFREPGAGLSDELRLLADTFEPLDKQLLERWNR